MCLTNNLIYSYSYYSAIEVWKQNIGKIVKQCKIYLISTFQAVSFVKPFNQPEQP